MVPTSSKSDKKGVDVAKLWFEDHFRNHAIDFRHEKYVNSTELSKYMWKLKDEKVIASINSWLSTLGRQTANFAATPDETRGKFAGIYNPSTLRNTTESKILSLSRNKLVIWEFKMVFFPHVFPGYSSAVINNFAFCRVP